MENKETVAEQVKETFRKRDDEKKMFQQKLASEQQAKQDEKTHVSVLPPQPKRKKSLTIEERANGIQQPEHFIVNRVQVKNGLVHVCSPSNYNPIEFNEEGKHKKNPIINNTYILPTYGEVNLNFFAVDYGDYLTGLQRSARGLNKNTATSKLNYFSLFNAVLNKYSNEIYVVIVNCGCHVFDSKMKYQGLFTFFDTGHGYLNCQIPVMQLQEEMLEERHRQELKRYKNNLDQAQAIFDAPLLRLEAAKVSYDTAQKDIEDKSKNFNKEWKYLT